LADQELASEVYRRIRYDLPQDAAAIGITANDGTVTLHGVVAKQEVAARASSIARNTPGVNEVVDLTTRY
jgi:osmotically-inducible protein OsmY